MNEKTKHRFWRRNKNTDKSVDQTDYDYSSPTKGPKASAMSRSAAPPLKTYNRPSAQFRPSPSPLERKASPHQSLSNTSTNPPGSPVTPVQVRHKSSYLPPSLNVTPKTAPSSPMTPSVDNTSGNPNNKWQGKGEDKKIKAMARLHNLAKAHTKDLPPGSVNMHKHTRKSLLDEAEEDEHMNTMPEDIPVPVVHPTRDQIIIDAVLGVNPCVPIDTKAHIKTYASKPTSPHTVVNFAMLVEGSNSLIELAKDSVKGLMSCAADLKDLNEGRGSVCFYDYKGGEGDGLERESGRGRSRRRGSYYDDEEDEESCSVSEDGDLVGLRVRDRTNSLPSNLSSDTTDTESGMESLANVMNRLDMEGDYGAAAPAAPTPAPVKRVAEKKRIVKSTNLNAPSHAAGISSFRMLTNNASVYTPARIPESSNNKSSQKDRSLSKFANANPTTNNTIPFDERSNERGSEDLYGIGGGFQRAESDMYARRVTANADAIHARYTMGTHDDDESVCTDEREI